jgi:hypothetical protein
MARYKRAAKTYRLVFDDEDMAGLEVTAKGCDTGTLLELEELRDAATGAAARELISRFAEYLVSWNLDGDDDQPVPADYKGLVGQDPDFVMKVIKAWIEAIGGVDPTSPDGSPDGGTSAEAPPPGLASASRSLAS